MPKLIEMPLDEYHQDLNTQYENGKSRGHIELLELLYLIATDDHANSYMKFNNEFLQRKYSVLVDYLKGRLNAKISTER